MKNTKTQIRGFKKPAQNTKIIYDFSFTPIEIARMKYNQLFEQQIIFKAEKGNKLNQFLDKINKFLNN
jgi:hypothetical protein